MKSDMDYSPSLVASIRHAPYNASLATSASASTSSIYSDASSQFSDDLSAISSQSSDTESCDSYCSSQERFPFSKSKPVPVEQRQNPRRTACGSSARAAPPPALVRQSDRKVNFVDSLVDSSTQIVEAIWPLSSVVCRSELGSKAVLPLRTFIQETLRRSRTSYSTLQVALYYLILIKPHVPKHNFTTEQPDDRHSDRALQCGRRMFLAALILASKYLQDRNYSARAWSKISGLNTQEINQNEMAFLIAVDWKLHIADDVFQRWTEIVLKYTPPPAPSSPGGAGLALAAQQASDWKHIIMKLDPCLTNIEGLFPLPIVKMLGQSDLSALSPRSILNAPSSMRGAALTSEPADLNTPTAKSFTTPGMMEPVPPTSLFNPGRLAPSLSLLPTPRLTPQPSGFCTPAANAASQSLGNRSAMGLAMGQANSATSVQYLDRLPMSTMSSPQGYCPARRSSLANSVSVASSPESMVSDSSRSSRSSRSSSISSMSSLASATLNSKLSASRFRAAKSCGDRVSQKPACPSVPEDFYENCYSSSPESYSGPVGKLGDLSIDTPSARREQQLEELARDPVTDAARALQELHRSHRSADSTPVARTGFKRSRPSVLESPLQDEVRGVLRGERSSESESWGGALVHSRTNAYESQPQFPVRPTLQGTRSTSSKRVCCSTEAATGFESLSFRRGSTLAGPGMWEGILN